MIKYKSGKVWEDGRWREYLYGEFQVGTSLWVRGEYVDEWPNLEDAQKQIEDSLLNKRPF